MAALNLIHYKNDRCYGASDPNGQPDIFNRPAKILWGNLTPYTDAESGASGTGDHDKDGDHMSDLTDDCWIMEEDTYTGDGNDDTVITFTESDLDSKFVRVVDGVTTYTWFRSEDMAGDATKKSDDAAGFAADMIQDISTNGQMTVGTVLNVNLREYF